MVRRIVCTVLLSALLAGCAQMYTAKTEAIWEERPDGTRRITYKSDKEQTNLDAQVDPKTGQFHVTVDKSGTPEGLIAAVAKQVEVLTGLMKDFAPLVAAALKAAAVAPVSAP